MSGRRTPYMFFADYHRDRIRSSGYSFMETGTILANMWRDLSESKRNQIEDITNDYNNMRINMQTAEQRVADVLAPTSTLPEMSQEVKEREAKERKEVKEAKESKRTIRMGYDFYKDYRLDGRGGGTEELKRISKEWKELPSKTRGDIEAITDEYNSGTISLSKAEKKIGKILNNEIIPATQEDIEYDEEIISRFIKRSYKDIGELYRELTYLIDEELRTVQPSFALLLSIIRDNKKDDAKTIKEKWSDGISASAYDSLKSIPNGLKAISKIAKVYVELREEIETKVYKPYIKAMKKGDYKAVKNLDLNLLSQEEIDKGILALSKVDIDEDTTYSIIYYIIAKEGLITEDLSEDIVLNFIEKGYIKVVGVIIGELSSKLVLKIFDQLKDKDREELFGAEDSILTQIVMDKVKENKLDIGEYKKYIPYIDFEDYAFGKDYNDLNVVKFLVYYKISGLNILLNEIVSENGDNPEVYKYLKENGADFSQMLNNIKSYPHRYNHVSKDVIDMVKKYITKFDVGRCVNKTNLITLEDLEDWQDIVVFITPGDEKKGENKKKDNGECYTTEDFRHTLRRFDGTDEGGAPNAVYQWEYPDNADKKYSRSKGASYRVYKLPTSGKWIQSSRALLTRYNTFVLKPIGVHPIGSSFGVSRLHGAEEMLYRPIPVNRKRYLLTGDYSLPEDNWVYNPGEDDEVSDHPLRYYKNVTVKIMPDGSFLENSGGTMLTTYDSAGDILTRLYTAKELSNYNKWLTSE